MNVRGDTGQESAAVAELWATLSPDPDRLSLLTGTAALDAPAGQRYLPFPPGRERLLVPLEGRLAAAGSVIPNLRLHHGRERLPRLLLAAGLSTGLVQAALRSRWQGIVTDDVASGERTLLAALQENWRPDVAALRFSVRKVTPNYKPTFVALDARGRPLGFAKLGVSERTNERLAQEIMALRSLGEHPIPGLRTPRLLADVAWQDCRIAMVEPLPRQARRFPGDEHAPLPILRDALASGRTSPAASVATKFGEMLQLSGDVELSEAGSAYIDRLVGALGDVPLAVGRAHGDWVPWNLAMCGADYWAFDWEHSEPEGTPALDIAHWHQLVLFLRDGQPFIDALDEALVRLRRDLGRVGIVGDEAEAVARLAALHVASRNASLFVTSGSWRPGVREVLLRVLTERD